MLAEPVNAELTGHPEYFVPALLQNGTAGGPFCEPFSIGADLCGEANSTAGCEAYNALCRAGSKVGFSVMMSPCLAIGGSQREAPEWPQSGSGRCSGMAAGASYVFQL